MDLQDKLLLCFTGLLAVLQLVWMQDVVPTVIPTDMYSFNEGAPIYARYLTVDPLDPTHIYVGGMGYVYRLQSSRIDLTYNDKSEYIHSTTIANHVCDSSEEPGVVKDLLCKNHIRTIMLLDHDFNNSTEPRIYVCGTGSTMPTEWHLRKSDLSIIANTRERVQSKCPYDPNDSYTCLYARTGNPENIPSFYSGTIKKTKSHSKEPVIYRPPIVNRANEELHDLLQTQSPADDENWLLNAVFVGSFERGMYVYFFFYETGTEFKGCMQQTVSRVARVCKNDEGGRNSRQTQWTSYFKATLDCNIPGSTPFRFNKITDVKQTQSGFIATFTVDGNPEIYGSAICKYTYTSLEAAFNGPYMAEDKDKIWTVVPDSDVPARRPGSCIQNSQEMTDDEFTFVNNHQLMANHVEQDLVNNLPYFYKMGVVFEKFVIDTSMGYTVYFIATNEGEIYKVIWLPTQRRAKVLAIYKPFNTPTKVWSMVKNGDSLYLGTDQEVKQLRFGQCASYENCNTCGQDPYCGWNPSLAICQQYNPNRVLARDVEMTNLDACVRVAACNSPYREEHVRIPGRPVHFTCTSHCVGFEEIRWYKDTVPIDFNSLMPDGKLKYIKSADNGIVIWNVTTADEGMYSCRSGRYLFAEYGLRLPGCAHDDEKCYWETEFNQWCDEFDKYQKQFNNWVCVKNECFANEQNCLPGAQQTCSSAP